VLRVAACAGNILVSEGTPDTGAEWAWKSFLRDNTGRVHLPSQYEAVKLTCH
jgi:hypothetical protein